MKKLVGMAKPVLPDEREVIKELYAVHHSIKRVAKLTGRCVPTIRFVIRKERFKKINDDGLFNVDEYAKETLAL